jgi:hypothetical protein
MRDWSLLLSSSTHTPTVLSTSRMTDLWFCGSCHSAAKLVSDWHGKIVQRDTLWIPWIQGWNVLMWWSFVEDQEHIIPLGGPCIREQTVWQGLILTHCYAASWEPYPWVVLQLHHLILKKLTGSFVMKLCSCYNGHETVVEVSLCKGLTMAKSSSGMLLAIPEYHNPWWSSWSKTW